MSELLNIKSATISADENSWGWSISGSFNDISTWGALKDYLPDGQEVKATIRGQIFHFFLDGIPTKNKSFGKTTFTFKGRSKTVKLTTPYSDQITKEWAATTAKTVAQELCDEKNITLDWQTVDWPLANRLLSVKDQYPLQIIQLLAKAVGAVVQSSKDGATLIVRPRFLVSPTKYSTVEPDHTISDIDDVETASENYLYKPGYDCIEISNQRTDAKTSYRINSEDNGRTLKVTSVPFQDIVLLNSAEGNIGIYYQGIFTEEKSDEISIVEGAGRLSNPYYGTVSSSWVYSNLGTLTISETGEIITAIKGQSILKISYITKHHKYQITPLSGVEKAQVYINES